MSYEALSPAEEAEIREDAPHLDQPQLVRAVYRLLATLDATRARLAAKVADDDA